MQLHEYPQAIADVQRDLLHSQQHITMLKETVMFCLNTIDRAIAFDTDLKNDAQRKAKRSELKETDSDYIEASLALKKAQDVYAELEIELQLLLNTFSVLKLERREAIASMELHVGTVA
jgi:hypothetical protein